MIDTLIVTLPGLLNIGAALFLLFLIYSIIGVSLFATIQLSDDINDHAL